WKNSRKNLRRANPYRLRQRHFFHVHCAWSCKSSVNDPHDYSAYKKRESHHPEAFQVFADLFRQCPSWNSCNHKPNQGPTQGMSKDGAIATLAPRKSPKKLQDALTKIDRQRQNCAELNDDGVHFPEPIVKIDVQ